jgi:hypothetical protein
MSQYPSPYSVPPQPGGWFADPWAALLAPARRASVLMFVLGGLLLGCGCCIGAMSQVPMDQMAGPQSAQLQQIDQQFVAKMGFSLSRAFLIAGLASGVPGLVMLVLGGFLRRGSMTVVVISLTVSLLASLLLAAALGLMVIGGLSGTSGVSGRQTLTSLGVWTVPLIMCLVLDVWLIQAIPNASKLAAAKAQFQVNYWQYQQNLGNQTPWTSTPVPPPPGLQPPQTPPTAPMP